MTDTVHSLIVVLDNDIRTDDVQSIIDAIKMMRRVIDVSPVVSDMRSHMAETRARTDLADKLWKVLYPREQL